MASPAAFHPNAGSSASNAILIDDDDENSVPGPSQFVPQYAAPAIVDPMAAGYGAHLGGFSPYLPSLPLPLPPPMLVQPPEPGTRQLGSTRASVHSSAIERRGRQRKKYEDPALAPIALNNNRASTRLRRKKAEAEQELVVIGNSHKDLAFWKDKYFKELGIDTDFIEAQRAAQSFDRTTIKTVVPNRYLDKHVDLPSDSFPGLCEILIPGRAVHQAYKENTAAERSVNRLVLWTDGSGRKGLAVTWRRSKENEWGPWEACGYQAQGALLDSDGMEHLAVIKAFDIACGMAHKAPGQLTSISIYTDSQSVLANLLIPKLKKSLSKQIAKKAYRLIQLGIAKIRLHWVPGHSKVPGNELADKVAGYASVHSFRNMEEHIDLSDDDIDDWSQLPARLRRMIGLNDVLKSRKPSGPIRILHDE